MHLTDFCEWYSDGICEHSGEQVDNLRCAECLMEKGIVQIDIDEIRDNVLISEDSHENDICD